MSFSKSFFNKTPFKKVENSVKPKTLNAEPTTSPLQQGGYEGAADAMGQAAYIPTSHMYTDMFNKIGLAAYHVTNWLKNNPGKHASGFDKETHDFLGRERTGKKGSYVRKGDKKRYEKLASQQGWTEDSDMSAEEYFFKDKGFKDIKDPREREEKLRQFAETANIDAQKNEGMTLNRDDHGFLTGGGEYMTKDSMGTTGKTDKSQLTVDDVFHPDLETYEEFKQRTGIKTT